MPLVVCATPIGNLEDVTYRVVAALGGADLVLCEDTRRTRVLLDRYGVNPPLERFDRQVERRRTPAVLELLEQGRTVALVSDAGLPGVNDPGTVLIGAALDRGLLVTVLPGPSAVETALVASGFVAGRFQFVGFVPRTAGARAALWDELRRYGWPAIAFESPARLPATLASLAEAEPDWQAAVCRELTKRFEEVARGRVADLAERFAEPPRGEITLVLAAAPRRGELGSERLAEGAAAVGELTALGVPRREAARIVAELVDVAANRLYRASL